MNQPATSKQLHYIEAIERVTGIRFNGFSIEEASNYIEQHLQLFKRICGYE